MIKVLKFILLCLTIWPLLYLGIFVLRGTIEFFSLLTSLTMFHLITVAIGMSTIIFYFIELYHNHLINGQSKMKWFLLFLFTGQFGLILYWKKYIW
jgi:hypothetical protein